MPHRATIVRISQPCPKDWAAMTPTRAGHHCAACQQVVVDFTQKTDAEVLAYFQQAAPSTTCGRFRAGQLGRPLRPAPSAARPPHWQRWLAGLLVAALTVQSCQTTTGEVQPITAHYPPPPPPTLGVPVVDSTTVGAIAILGTDSAAAVAVPPGPADEPAPYLLGAPQAQ